MKSFSQLSRSIERDFFGSLVGLLLGAVISRFALLLYDINLYALLAIVLISGWSVATVFHFASNQSSTTIESVQTIADRIRATCLRVILWLLGSAAVLGVLSVLTGSFDLIGRVASTAAITACAAALLAPFLKLLDAEKQWRVGVLGVANVLSAYLLATPSIWSLGYRGDETALTALVLMLMLPVGLAAIQMTHNHHARWAGIFATFLYLMTTTIFIISCWTIHGNDAAKMIGTGLTLLGFGALVVVSLVGVTTSGERRHWRWIGIAASMVASLMTLYDLWLNGNLKFEWIVVAGSIAVVVAHSNLSCMAPLSGTQVLWRFGTIAALASSAAALDVDLLLSPTPMQEITILGRIALASGILASTGTLAMLILVRLNRNSLIAAHETEISTVVLRCPRCNKRLIIPLGHAGCEYCGLGITIEIAEHTDANAPVIDD